MTTYIRWFRDIRLTDLALVGGKTASLGELYGELGAAGVRVPNGFALTADAYRALLETNRLGARVARILNGVTGEDIGALAAAGAELRGLVEAARWPTGLEEDVIAAYRTLSQQYGAGT
ncbi:MAG TPA: PEP/pyruvate-binding domain-containing protein, partial [Candidatus Methylomirabilis sp.]|nr:PEP/pyruvate-binding domain-containing protein [Candidatus Methylomirabilis sp.]